SDIVGTNEPQPVDPLGIGEFGGLVAGVHAGSLRYQNGSTGARGEGVSPSFRDGPKARTRNLEILRCAMAHHSSSLSRRPGMSVERVLHPRTKQWETPMTSLTDLQRRIEKGELTPDVALAQSLAAIEAQEETLGAFAHRAPNPRAQQQGPLRGIAVGIKDIIDTADMPTEMGAAIYKGHRPRADAPVVMQLKQAGATVVGKTTTTAFAANDPTATLNPHNHAHTPGGSSSGSAAAVGAGMIPLALGTQTGGSVIRPASFCGATAIKPSYRLLPTVGVKCYSWTLDTVGLFAASVEDLAHGLSAMTARPELMRHSPTRPPRIGVVTQDFAGAADETSEEALRIASTAAERAGASVRPLKLPDLLT